MPVYRFFCRSRFQPISSRICNVTGQSLLRVHDAVEICPGVSSTGDLAGQSGSKSLVLQTPKEDNRHHWLRASGIAHIIQWATALLRDLLLVMGGFHLMNDNEALIRDMWYRSSGEIGRPIRGRVALHRRPRASDVCAGISASLSACWRRYSHHTQRIAIIQRQHHT